MSNRYRFEHNPKKFDYLLVINPMGEMVGELYHDHALVVVTMYDNMFKRNIRLANEFMYGHMLGMTYAMTYGDKYPKCIVSEMPNGGKSMKIIDPLLGVVFDDDIKKAPGAQTHIDTIMDKAFNDEKEH